MTITTTTTITIIIKNKTKIVIYNNNCIITSVFCFVFAVFVHPILSLVFW